MYAGVQVAVQPQGWPTHTGIDPKRCGAFNDRHLSLIATAWSMILSRRSASPMCATEVDM